MTTEPASQARRAHAAALVHRDARDQAARLHLAAVLVMNWLFWVMVKRLGGVAICFCSGKQITISGHIFVTSFGIKCTMNINPTATQITRGHLGALGVHQLDRGDARVHDDAALLAVVHRHRLDLRDRDRRRKSRIKPEVSTKVIKISIHYYPSLFCQRDS